MSDLLDITTPTPGVVMLTLTRPDRLNTLNVHLVAALTAALDDIASDKSCRVVIITGAGRAFCAGLDLNGYGDPEREAEEGRPLATFGRQQDIAHLTERINSLPQPVIAAVNGPAAGGGLALVCASDIRIAAPEAVFAVSFITAGYSACDIGVSWLLPRIVGAGNAHELMLTGRRFDASHARSIGLISQIVDSGNLLAEALRIAGEILNNPPVSVEMTKKGMWLALETPTLHATIEFENRQQVITALTEDAAEATTAFLEKRTPTYRRR
ncbi:enoyl-CoA hydratase/isomerase family protein [Rhodococcus sp. KBS0724]|jgi:enoyl-CoA hydratase|uniref:enoyl-CoA hydratase/isomerase family protein n=1 Tax=Rhodococcus sp. KBS0724 TaxID=1179674 RepID=UPI00110EAC58|nr:enoyl-CoA hydratase/isomerase family protein [Rhodococcus sp. KBS0724]TSD45268.1 enoyl-CoA hydratase/isomerase family protein [Rhodococcus sp. KBS0724]